MGQPYSVTVYLGANDQGRQRMENLESLIKLKGFRSKAEAIQYCLDSMFKLDQITVEE